MELLIKKKGVVHNKTKFEHTKELFKSTNLLNLCKLNILSIAVFMHRVHTKASPPVFTGRFEISHLYSTRSSNLNFSKPKLKLTKAKYTIFRRAPTILHDFVEDCLKSIEKTPFFKLKMKCKLLN